MKDPSPLQSVSPTDGERPKLRLSIDGTQLEQLPPISNTPQVRRIKPDSALTNDMLGVADTGKASYLEFSYAGRLSEYILLWLSNGLLTSLSFGILTPWTIIRTRSHFYRNIRLDGDSLQSSTKALGPCLLSLTIALCIGSGFAVLTQTTWDFHEEIALGLGIAACALIPALMRSMVAAIANAITYRGVSLRFSGGWASAYAFYLLYPMLCVATTLAASIFWHPAASAVIASLWISLIVYSHRTYKFQHLSYGRQPLKFCGNFEQFRKIYTVPSLCWIVLQAVIAGAIIIAVANGILHPEFLAKGIAPKQISAGELSVGGIVILCVIFIQVAFYWWGEVWVKTKSRAFYIEHLELKGLGLIDAYKVGRYAKLEFSNLIMRCLSLGLLGPWAALREHRYLVQNVALIGSSATLRRFCERAEKKESNQRAAYQITSAS